MTGPVDGATQVAAGYLDVMKREPLSLSLVVMNLALLFVFWFILNTVAKNNSAREGQLFEQQKHTAELLSRCVVPPTKTDGPLVHPPFAWPPTTPITGTEVK